MLKGQLYINGKDAYTAYGIIMSETALSTLMTPAPSKDYINNSSRLVDGKRVFKGNVKMDEREMTLSFNMIAKDKDTFLTNYAKFCEEVLAKGEIVIHTSFLPNVWYRCIYISCSQFSQFMRKIASFSLKLNEPDPSNRGKIDKDTLW